MHEFDMYLKQELKVKYYLRYADDLVILSENKEYMENILPKLHTFLSEKLPFYRYFHWYLTISGEKEYNSK